MPLALVIAVVLAQSVPSAGQPIAIDIQGQPFTELRTDSTKPYLHPLRTPSGKVITRQFPMADVAGETKDHPHHRGLWFSHGDVNGWDFWSNEKDQKGAGKGRGDIIVTRSKKKGKSEITLTADWKSGDGVLLREDRVIKFRGDQNARIIDLDITLTALKDVKFGDTKEGTFAIRLRDELTEQKGGAKMTNAEGKAGEKLVWGKPSPWVDYVGQLEGETVGVAILDHPSNPGHPTHWHARAYGLFAANIFGLHDFYKGEGKDGSRTLKSGEKLHFRYEVVVHGGDTATAGIAEHYLKFSKSR